ncbi:unnamed protein product [Tilletia laevis]|uniref:Peptidase M20 dimerisation domain-containing protein n=3 Tax=Tilletia TaxID=13289 RepID=A0A8X7MNM4_9BASI|nr:hypothetical protein CF336_g6292 [Tilletia laevis]KAE8242324.1 hypothetical protein A4X06_0g7009 [Tilletia controversa]KAE8253469.1 hypothetical protein A4X03_0g5889 [Tilletia caries]KAE8205166.1 hypothetical protein CF335_g2399 [Tilletia laevis]CAD6890643.1 unnamed protein product [Tilletia caries]
MVGCFSVLTSRRGRRVQEHDTASASPQQQVVELGRSMMEEEVAHPLLPAYSPPGVVPPFQGAELAGVLKDLHQNIESTVFGLSGELRQLSLKMFEYKELAFEEFKTHDLFCDWFEDKFAKKAGWKVTRHAYRMKTAFSVEFEHRPKGHEGPIKTIGYNSELDALPGVGHACGHPLIAICGVASAIATADALVKHNLPGKVVLLGTPAEEAGGGKCILLKNGAYEGMDVCLMAHPGPYSTVGSSLAVSSYRVTYTGKPAHAAAAPWEGINALDAAVQAYVSMSTLRQQVPPSHRMHAVIKGDNLAVNIIPEEVVLLCNARAPTKVELEALIPRVKNCFEAGALATGCKMDVKTTMSYLDLENSTPMTDTFRHIMASKYDDVFQGIDMIGSTDFGDVTYAVPSLHPLYSIPLTDPKGGANHTHQFEKDARTEAAHKKTLQVAVALALTGVKVAVDEEYAREVMQMFEDWKKGQRSSP